MQWMTIFHKEIVENWRNRKWIWVPLVIMLLTSMDPLTYYYLPVIIEHAGGLPEGAVIEVPSLDPTEVVMMSLEQLSTFGVLVVVLISMGTIAGERKSGITEVILVKPIRHYNYVTAKWSSFLLLVFVSSFLGLLLNWYYTNLLYGHLSFILLLKIVFYYSFWLAFALTITIFYNTLLKLPGLVAACTIATLVVMGAINTIFEYRLTIFPNQLSTHILTMVETNTISSKLIGTSTVIGTLIILLLVISIEIFKRKEIVN